jgi:hypothetical protein
MAQFTSAMTLRTVVLAGFETAQKSKYRLLMHAATKYRATMVPLMVS